MNTKKTVLLATLLLTCLCSNVAMAEDTDVSALDNAIYIENFEAGIGRQVNISIRMKNSSQIRGYQCDLYLPEGMSFALDGNNNPIAKISGGRTTTEYHSLTKSIQSDGALRLLCNASEVHYFSGNDGEVAQVTVDVSTNMIAGEYPIRLKNIKMGATSNPEDGTNIDEVISTLTVVVQNYDVMLDENSTVAPEASEGAVAVLVKRTIKANSWSTICLPFAMTEAQVKAAFGEDVELGDFKDYDTTKDDSENIIAINVNFDDVTAIEANHPYIIKVTGSVTEFIVDGVVIAPEDNPCVEYDNGLTGKKRKVLGTFTGTYVADFDFYNEAENYPLFISQNKFYYATENTNHMKAFRAYFDFVDNLPEAEEAESRIFMRIGDKATGIRSIRQTSDGSYYDLQGRRVVKPGKGLYVKDGRKVVVK